MEKKSNRPNWTQHALDRGKMEESLRKALGGGVGLVDPKNCKKATVSHNSGNKVIGQK